MRTVLYHVVCRFVIAMLFMMHGVADCRGETSLMARLGLPMVGYFLWLLYDRRIARKRQQAAA